MEQPELPAGSLLPAPEPPYVVGALLNQTCDVDYASGTDATSNTLTFDGTSWVSADPTFECLPSPGWSLCVLGSLALYYLLISDTLELVVYLRCLVLLLFIYY